MSAAKHRGWLRHIIRMRKQAEVLETPYKAKKRRRPRPLLAIWELLASASLYGMYATFSNPQGRTRDSADPLPQRWQDYGQSSRKTQKPMLCEATLHTRLLIHECTHMQTDRQTDRQTDIHPSFYLYDCTGIHTFVGLLNVLLLRCFLLCLLAAVLAIQRGARPRSWSRIAAD